MIYQPRYPKYLPRSISKYGEQQGEKQKTLIKVKASRPVNGIHIAFSFLPHFTVDGEVPCAVRATSVKCLVTCPVVILLSLFLL